MTDRIVVEARLFRELKALVTDYRDQLESVVAAEKKLREYKLDALRLELLKIDPGPPPERMTATAATIHDDVWRRKMIDRCNAALEAARKVLS